MSEVSDSSSSGDSVVPRIAGPLAIAAAAGGMLAKIKAGEIQAEERVLFWHTGGTPALFAFAGSLLNK